MSGEKLKGKGDVIFPKTAVFIYIVAIILILLKEVLVASLPLMLNIMVDGAVLGKEVQASTALSFVSLFIKVEKGFASIASLSLIMFLFYVLATGSAYISDVLNAIATEDITKRLRDAMHKSIQRFTYQHYMNCETGDLIQRCTSNIETIKTTLNHFFVKGVAIIFSVLYIFSLMWSQNPKMALLSSITIPIIFLSSFLFFVYVKKRNEIAYKKEAIMTQAAQESLTGMRVVKAFSMQTYEIGKFEEASEIYTKEQYKINMLDSFFWATLDAITFIQIIFVTFYGSYLVYLGEMTMGQVVAFTQYVGMLVFSVRHLGRIISNFGRLSVSIKRIKEVLNAPKEETDREESFYKEENPKKEVRRADDVASQQDEKYMEVSHHLRGILQFEHVSFAYPNQAEKEILSDVSFSIKEGEMLGIMGITGSGKTSIVYLLSRLYSQNSGNIKIGGIDIKTVSLSHLRSSLGIVLQEPFLYGVSIKENIRMGKPIASDEEVIEVAKKASLHDDVMGFKDGYDTIVGENGITLSGGQKQRLSIARTLLKDAPIIVFDDSLSSVDSATDAQIRSAILNMKANKILIVISHRLSSIMNADKIIVLEEGKVAEEGTHAELIMKAGTYKRVYEMQHSMLKENI